jgi:hypothetical protein
LRAVTILPAGNSTGSIFFRWRFGPLSDRRHCVEQQVDAIGGVLGRNLVAEPQYVGFIRDIGDIRRDT